MADSGRPRSHPLHASSAASRPVPPLRLSGSLADKDRGNKAASSLAALLKGDSKAPKPKDAAAKPKEATAASTKNRKRPPPQRSTSLSQSMPAGQSATHAAAKCSDLWRSAATGTE